MAAMAAAVSQRHLTSVVALGGGVQRTPMLEDNRAGIRLAAISLRPTKTSGVLPLIECSKHAQEKATKHHEKSRPKKRNPYDRNRKGPTYYPRVGKPPPIWGLDNGEALTSSDIEGNTVVQI